MRLLARWSEQPHFAAVDAGPSVLSPEELTADALPELDSATLARIEDDWRARVLRGEG